GSVDRDPSPCVRSGTESDDDWVRQTELGPDLRKIFEKWTGILAIVRPFPHDRIDIVTQPREAATRGGKFQSKDFHFMLIARAFSDFISNKIQRACSGMNSGNRSAHSITEMPSPKRRSEEHTSELQSLAYLV